MTLEELKIVFDECGELSARLCLSELNCPYKELARVLPQLLESYIDINSPGEQGSAWKYILQQFPHLGNLCPWDKITTKDWAYIAAMKINLEKTCPWHKFSNDDIMLTLSIEPKLVRHCNLEQLTGWHVMALILSEPSLKEFLNLSKLIDIRAPEGKMNLVLRAMMMLHAHPTMVVYFNLEQLDIKWLGRCQHIVDHMTETQKTLLYSMITE